MEMTQKEYADRWKNLLHPKRFRESLGQRQISYAGEHYNRNPYDSDYLRIIMSAPFRRLQDKAQVFPLERNDFVRTRLTHSIEVSGIARSLGVSIDNIFLKEKYITSEHIGQIPSLLSVAGLIHDIGNPPFGHFGEKTIQTFFKNHFKDEKFKDSFDDIYKYDFENFDGNVQGLRILLKLSLAKDDNSLNLTYPTLSTIIKYPRNYVCNNDYIKTENKISKFAYFQTEKKRYNKIDAFFNLNEHRHPLTFILEAADDIAYSVSDIEDGIKKNAITIESLSTTLSSTEFMADNHCSEILKLIEGLNISISKDFPNKALFIAQECRTKIQTFMINDIIATFMDNLELIMNGQFNNELIDSSKSATLRKFTKNISNFNFNSKGVIKSELVGENVITFLLENFISAINSVNYTNTKTKEGKLYEIISKHYKYAINKYEVNKFDSGSKEFNKYEKYKKYLLVTDYISSMTDSFALSLFNELQGYKSLD